MEVQVLFFGALKDIAGRKRESIQLAENSTLRDLLDHCRAQIPALKEYALSIAMSVNQEYATPDTRLRNGDEIALLPPVSGGATAKGEVFPADAIGSHHAILVREKIDTVHSLDAIKRASDGAIAVFEGVVRDHTRGRRTLYLDYEAYEKMAVRQIDSLISQALTNFKIRDVKIVHRLGRIGIGETSVLIVVASEHRGAAFDACRWLIDTLKRTVPIWKREYFEGGAVWADGEPFPVEIPRAQGTP